MASPTLFSNVEVDTIEIIVARDLPEDVPVFPAEGAGGFGEFAEFDRYVMPLLGGAEGVEIGRTSSYPERTVIGDENAFKHDWMSAVSQSTWQGGGQVLNAQSSNDIDRYFSVSTMDTRWPKGLRPLPETLELDASDIGNGVCWVLGDFRVAGDVTLYGAVGDKLVIIDGGDLLDTGDSIPSSFVPVAHAQQFKGSHASATARLWIPLGEDGYATYDGTTCNAYTHVKVKSFLQINRALYALSTDDQIWANTGGLAGTTTDGWTASALFGIEETYEAQHLTRFRDSTGAPVIACVTTSGVLILDIDGSRYYESYLTYPQRNDAGVCSTMWRTNLYVAYGVDWAYYTGGTITYNGLGRGDGVADTVATAIIGMEDAWNEMLAYYVCNPDPDQPDSNDNEFGSQFEGSLPVGGIGYKALLMRLDGYGGIHTAWVAPRFGTDATNIRVSSEGGSFCAVWAFDGSFWRQELPRNFQNPDINPTQAFMTSGELTSSWWYPVGDVRRIVLASQQIRVPKTGRDTDGEQIKTYIAFDQSDSWEEAITVNSGDRPNNSELFFEQRFGLQPFSLPDLSLFYTGQICNSFRYRIQGTYKRLEAMKLAAMSHIYFPLMGDSRTFTFRVDCSLPDVDGGAWGQTNQERRDFLDSLPQRAFVGFAYRDLWVSVKCTGASGFDATGQAHEGDRVVTFVESWDV